MSTYTWKTTRLSAFEDMVRAHAAVHDVLEAEYVTDNWYARWRMLLWRKKRGVIMQRIASIVQHVPTPQATVTVFGIGNGKFAPTGKGEKAVPTTTLGKTILRTARCMKRMREVEVMAVPEERTTMCCHGCQRLLQNVRDASGRVMRGLKKCMTPSCRWAHDGRPCNDVLVSETEVPEGHRCGGCGARSVGLKDENGERVRGLTLCRHAEACSGKEAFRLRNRDKNAARNIWEVVDAIVRGVARPGYLKKKPRERAPREVVS
jgi:hypothetical protein